MYKTLVLWASSRGPRVCKSVQVFMRVSIEGCNGVFGMHNIARFSPSMQGAFCAEGARCMGDLRLHKTPVLFSVKTAARFGDSMSSV